MFFHKSRPHWGLRGGLHRWNHLTHEIWTISGHRASFKNRHLNNGNCFRAPMTNSPHRHRPDTRSPWQSLLTHEWRCNMGHTDTHSCSSGLLPAVWCNLGREHSATLIRTHAKLLMRACIVKMQMHLLTPQTSGREKRFLHSSSWYFVLTYSMPKHLICVINMNVISHILEKKMQSCPFKTDELCLSQILF